MFPHSPFGPFRASCLAALLVALVACSEDGDVQAASDRPSNGSADASDSVDSVPSDEGSSDTSVGNVNGPLTGRIVRVSDYPVPNTIVSLDLQSGLWTVLEGNDLSAESYLRGQNTTLSLEPDHTAPGRIVSTVRNCSQTATTCVGFLDASGRLESAIAYDAPRGTGGSGVARRSRDGRFVAFVRLGEIGVEDDLLNIRTVADGEIVSRGYFGPQSGSSYDWLPDGSLLIYTPSFGSVGPVNLVRTAPYTTTEASRFTLPARYDNGTVDQIRVSPDGNSVMVQLRLGRNVPVVIDLASGATYEPVSPDSEVTLVTADIAWSPDSQWLLFRNVNLIYAGPLDPGGANASYARDNPAVYAVRANGGSYPLPTNTAESNDNARIVVSRPVADPEGEIHPDNVKSGALWTE